MKKSFLALLALLLISVSVSSADSIGENFEAAGLSFSANGTYRTDFDVNKNYNVGIGANLYVLDNLAFGLHFQYFGSKYSGGESNSLYISIPTSYAIVPNPTAATGFVLQTGMNFGYSYDLDDKIGSFEISPFIRANYFITPRIAPFVSLRGIDFVFDSNDTNDLIKTYFEISIGLAYFRPHKDIVLVK